MVVPDTDAWIVRAFSRVGFVKEFCDENIHPNYITLVALLLSVSIPFLHSSKRHVEVVMCILIRQVCDLLDGPVARTCKKTSKIGGFLDTAADYVFVGSMIQVACASLLQLNAIASYGVAVLAVLVLVLYTVSLYSVRALHDHSVFKGEGGGMHAVVANNSIIVSVVIALTYYTVTSRRISFRA